MSLVKYGDWGLGIGDWGLGNGPTPQSPIPNPQSPEKKYFTSYIFLKVIYYCKLILTK